MSQEPELTNESFPLLTNRELVYFKKFFNDSYLSVYKHNVLKVYEVFKTYIEDVRDYNNKVAADPEENTPPARGKAVGKRVMTTLTENAAKAYIDELIHFYHGPSKPVVAVEIEKYLYIVKSRAELDYNESDEPV